MLYGRSFTKDSSKKEISLMIELNRRQFLVASAQVVGGLMFVPPMKSWGAVNKKNPLTFYHTHTGENLKINHSLGKCPTAVQKKLNAFLRDHRTGDVHRIDPFLLDIITKIKKMTGSKGTIEVISGYRSPLTNQLMHERSNGVAKRSLHMQGQAIDIRIDGMPIRKLKEMAVALKLGGVGYYPESDFVHLDTGDFRTW